MTERQQRIKEIMDEGNYCYSTARYIYDKGGNYKPRPRQGVTYQELLDLGITIELDSNEESGFKVFQDGKRRPIALRKTGQYKYGEQKFHYYTFYSIKEDDKLKQKPISLASLIYVLLLHKDIPAGYVIDHIDNDSFNNKLTNLQMITIGDNVRKDSKGHNQYNIIR